MARSGHHGELISSGYQGVVYKIRADSLRPDELDIQAENPESQYLIVKEAMGFPIARKLREIMIRREYEIYRRLGGVPGIPKCYGLKDGKHLLLEFVEGRSLRMADSELTDREGFFYALLEIILSAHRAGVSHVDMKRKDNILVTSADEPCLIDFGTAVIRKEESGFSRWLFRQSCQLDLNAWIKHKYLGRYEDISAEDAPYYRPTTLERSVGFIVNLWRRLTFRRWREARRWAKAGRQSHR